VDVIFFEKTLPSSNHVDKWARGFDRVFLAKVRIKMSPSSKIFFGAKDVWVFPSEFTGMIQSYPF